MDEKHPPDWEQDPPDFAVWGDPPVGAFYAPAEWYGVFNGPSMRSEDGLHTETTKYDN